MSFCRKEGKDTIIFATKENHDIPSSIKLPEPEKPSGVILADGSINWNCPCLGGMPTGPCGLEFREAFSCFHYNKADLKAGDCFDSFSKMQECMKQYPTLYASGTNKSDDDKYFDDDDDEKDSRIEDHDQNNTNNDLKENNRQNMTSS